MRMGFRCFTCGFEAEGYTELQRHDCPMADKLDEVERKMVGALLMSEGCDHFCCGLSENACKAKSIVSYLRSVGIL